MPTTAKNIEAVKRMMLNNRIRKVADDIGISFGSGQTIFPDVLVMKRATTKIVEKLLNLKRK